MAKMTEEQKDARRTEKVLAARAPHLVMFNQLAEYCSYTSVPDEMDDSTRAQVAIKTVRFFNALLDAFVSGQQAEMDKQESELAVA